MVGGLEEEQAQCLLPNSIILFCSQPSVGDSAIILVPQWWMGKKQGLDRNRPWTTSGHSYQPSLTNRHFKTNLIKNRADKPTQTITDLQYVSHASFGSVLPNSPTFFCSQIPGMTEQFPMLFFPGGKHLAGVVGGGDSGWWLGLGRRQKPGG